MDSCDKRSRKGWHSLKYRPHVLKTSFLEPAKVPRVERLQNYKHSTFKSSSNRISTSMFISTVEEIWNCINHPLILHHKVKVQPNWKYDNDNHVFGQRRSNAAPLGEIKNFNDDFFCAGCSPKHNVELHSELFKLIQKIIVVVPYQKLMFESIYYKTRKDNIHQYVNYKVDNVFLACDLTKIYKLSHEGVFATIKDFECPTKVVCRNPTSKCVSESNVPSDIRTAGSVDGAEKEKQIDKKHFNALCKTSSSCESSLCLDCLTNDSQESFLIKCIVDDISGTSNLKCKRIQNDGRCPPMQTLEFENETAIQPVTDREVHNTSGKRHGLAGALAGSFVSLFLHPFDTIKTVIQARSADPKSIHHVFRSITSERGVMGLYRGLASNIVTSAPISAIYTFTYESVKESLLPFFLKEYHSFVYCVAGGCASTATSFIFTPSERIKQQMQVGSYYQNSWNALIGIYEKGGLRSLYTGWGAVLSRNVPHSIIKFYTYERLKQFILPTGASNCHYNSFQMG